MTNPLQYIVSPSNMSNMKCVASIVSLLTYQTCEVALVIHPIDHIA